MYCLIPTRRPQLRGKLNPVLCASVGIMETGLYAPAQIIPPRYPKC